MQYMVLRCTLNHCNGTDDGNEKWKSAYVGQRPDGYHFPLLLSFGKKTLKMGLRRRMEPVQRLCRPYPEKRAPRSNPPE